MRFVVETVEGSRPAWWLHDEQDRVIAWAGRTFADLAHADQAAHDFRVNPDDAEYRVQVGTDGRWRWTAWHPGGLRVAVSGDWSADEEAARDAAGRVRQQAGTAIGP